MLSAILESRRMLFLVNCRFNMAGFPLLINRFRMLKGPPELVETIAARCLTLGFGLFPL